MIDSGNRILSTLGIKPLLIIAVGVVVLAAGAAGAVVAANNAFALVVIGIIVLFLVLPLSLESWLYMLVAMIMIIPEGGPIERLFRVPGTPILWYEAFFFLLIGRWLMEIALHRREFPKTQYNRVLGAFWIVCGVAILRGVLAGTDAYPIMSDMHVFAFYLLIPLVFGLCTEKPDRFPLIAERLTLVVITASALGSIVQIVALVVWPDRALQANRLISRNDEILVLALVFVLFSVGAQSKWRWLYALCGVIISFKLALTVSRWPILQLSVYWLVLIPVAFLLFRRRRLVLGKASKLVLIAAILATLTAGILSLVLSDQQSSSGLMDRYSARIAGYSQVDSISSVDFIEQRLYYWPQFESFFRDSPLFGSGAGTVFVTIRPEIGVPYAANVFIDNLFATLLAKVGIVGLTVFLWIWVLVTRDAYRVLARSQISSFLPPSVIAFAVFIPVLWLGMFGSSMLSHFRVSVVILAYVPLLELAAIRTTESAQSLQS